MPRSNRSATELRGLGGERGSGLLSSVFAIAIIAAVLGVVSNVALGLWVRSTVDSVAYDTARHVASSPATGESSNDDQAVQLEALNNARDLLGGYSKEVSMEFVSPPASDTVALHVSAPGVSIMPRMFADTVVVGGIDRTIVVRKEDTR